MDQRLALGADAHWTWHLFPNQCYPGRVQLNLIRPCEGALTALTDAEWLSLHAALKRFEAVLQPAFAPDRLNIKQLGNQLRQTHVHLIPRYERPRAWDGVTITDTRWGDDPYPEPPSPLSDAQTVALAVWLRAQL